jgi:uracil phosphoribosyltransferase
MTEAMLSLFPDAHVYYLGLFREKVTLQPVECKFRNSSTPSGH